jgi:hypothetical protein
VACAPFKVDEERIEPGAGEDPHTRCLGRRLVAHPERELCSAGRSAPAHLHDAGALARDRAPKVTSTAYSSGPTANVGVAALAAVTDRRRKR